jgi:MFS family permease
LIASIPNKKRGLMMMISIIIAGVSLIIFSASTSWPLLLGIMVFVGLGETVLMVMGHTLIQYYTEKEYRGRVISLIQMQVAFNSFGTFFAGVLSESIGVQWALGSFATLLVLLAVFVLAFVPRVRNLN